MIGIEGHPLISVKCEAGISVYSTTPPHTSLEPVVPLLLRVTLWDTLGPSRLPLHLTPGS